MEVLGLRTVSRFHILLRYNIWCLELKDAADAAPSNEELIEIFRTTPLQDRLDCHFLELVCKLQSLPDGMLEFFPNCTALWLSGNDLRRLPRNMQQFNNLTWLSLEYNHWLNALPSSITALTNLTELSIGSTGITNTAGIPELIRNRCNGYHINPQETIRVLGAHFGAIEAIVALNQQRTAAIVWCASRTSRAPRAILCKDVILMIARIVWEILK